MTEQEAAIWCAELRGLTEALLLLRDLRPTVVNTKGWAVLWDASSYLGKQIRERIQDHIDVEILIETATEYALDQRIRRLEQVRQQAGAA